MTKWLMIVFAIFIASECSAQKKLAEEREAPTANIDENSSEPAKLTEKTCVEIWAKFKCEKMRESLKLRKRFGDFYSSNSKMIREMNEEVRDKISREYGINVQKAQLHIRKMMLSEEGRQRLRKLISGLNLESCEGMSLKIEIGSK